MRRCRTGVAAVALWLAACASPRPAAPDPARLAWADAELFRGCYDCLVAARAAYHELATQADREAMVTRVFEADLLIALREKELGLTSSGTLEEARVLAIKLPAHVEAARYLALVDAVPPSDLATPTRELLAFRDAHARALGVAHDQIAWLSHGPLRSVLRDYLRLALGCAYEQAGTEPAAESRPSGVLALDYRAAICGFGSIATLEAVRHREPRFVETSLFIANTELALAPREGPRRARAHLAEVATRFPTSAAVNYLIASHDLFVGEYDRALAAFDRTLAARPDHDRAQLGRTLCLDHLGRAAEVVASATQLLALGEDHLADALFWRARGRLALGQLADARRDILAAKAVAATSDVLSLSGLLAYELDDLDAARRDLVAAMDSAPTDCRARWYLAQVERRGQHWIEAGHAFRAAMMCFREQATDRLVQATALRARGDLDPAYQTRVSDSLSAAAEEDRHEQHRAALGGATCFVAGDDLAAARSLLDVAAEDPKLAGPVARLRGQLEQAQNKMRNKRTRTR